MRGLVRGVAKPERTGFDRLADLDEDRPVIFAANHHSHVDAPTAASPRSPSRGDTSSSSAPPRTTSSRPASPARCRHSPWVRSRSIARGQPQVRRPRGRADRGRLEHPHLPGRRPQSRRLGPTVPRWRGVPLGAHRRAGRAHPPRGHRPHHGQGDEPTPSGPHDRHLRQAHATATRRRRAGRSALASRPRSTSSRTRARRTGGLLGGGRLRALTPVLTGPEGPSWRRAWALGDRKGRTRRAQPRLARPRLRASRRADVYVGRHDPTPPSRTRCPRPRADRRRVEQDARRRRLLPRSGGR